MDILIKGVTIANSNSPFNGLRKDILVQNGIITQIEDQINDYQAQTVIKEEDLNISLGWTDVFANFNDPGFEHNETVHSGAQCAAAGGYTNVCILPNTSPIIHGKTQVEYIVQKNAHLPIQVHPIGAVSKLTEGKELAEMYDMFQAGAVAFSDGIASIQNAGLMLKALQYVKAFNGTIIQVPIDKHIGASGLMHEGIISTQLGLPGIPAIAETIIIKRDLDLLAYTQSKLHITGVSSAASLALIKEAKERGLQVTCSVTPYHLFFSDEDLQQYDTVFKTNPPLRSKDDRLALQHAVNNGLIDCIASHHQPYDWDYKSCEFEYAKFGASTIQTAFAAVNTSLNNLTPLQVATIFAENPRKILAISTTPIQVGCKESFTLFTLNSETKLTVQTNKSKSANSPFMNIALKGKVWGTIHSGILHQS